jgi:hypothetical protein
MVRCLASWKASIFPPVVLVCVLAAAGCSSARSPHGAPSAIPSASPRSSLSALPRVAPTAAGPTSAATAQSTQAPPSKLPAVIWDCTAPPRWRQESRVRLKAITFACTDNGNGLEHAAWTSWTSTGATGTGVIWMKTCQPDCATGGIAFYPASITLSDIVRVRSGEFAVHRVDRELPGIRTALPRRTRQGQHDYPHCAPDRAMVQSYRPIEAAASVIVPDEPAHRYHRAAGFGADGLPV